MEGARQGIFPCMVELQYRIPDSYSPGMLDIVLSFLKEPELGTDPDSHQQSLARISLLALTQVAVALAHRPSLCLQAARKLLPALGGIMAWVYLLLHLKRSEWYEGYSYTFSDFAMHKSIILTLTDITHIHEMVEGAVTAHPLVIDFAVVSWVVATSQGHALIYPSGYSPMDAGCRDGPEEPTIALFHLISTKNAPALAEAILSWRICSPHLFFQRGSQRMSNLVKVNDLPGLGQVPDIPMEDLNFSRIVMSVKALVNASPDLGVPLLESRAPAQFMDALVRAAERADLVECRTGWMDCVDHHLFLAGHVASWAELQSSHFVQTVKAVIYSGVVSLLKTGLELPKDRSKEAWKPWTILLQRIVKWAYSSPGLFKFVWTAIAENLAPCRPDLPEGSVVKWIFMREVEPLHILSHHRGGIYSGMKLCDSWMVRIFPSPSTLNSRLPVANSYASTNRANQDQHAEGFAQDASPWCTIL